MNSKVIHFYQESSGDDSGSGHFHKVVALHLAPSMEWHTLSAKIPLLPKGWFELSRLNSTCRVEFVRDFWITKLPFNPKLHEFLPLFFENLEDIGIYLTQQTFESPFDVQMVYSLKNDRGFFHGAPPCIEEDLNLIQKKIDFLTFPADYLAFLQIHDGFSKYMDPGLIKVSCLENSNENFQDYLNNHDALLTSQKTPIDPKSLIPFYKSFGLHCYQCFNADWYPEQEMGNVYYSGSEHSISDYRNRSLWTENLAFPTFLDWLLFYLKDIEEI